MKPKKIQFCQTAFEIAEDYFKWADYCQYMYDITSAEKMLDLAELWTEIHYKLHPQ